MSEDPILTFIEQQDWLAPVQEKGEAVVKDIYKSIGPSAQIIKNFLHGVWLGHPLHSAITDVPVGSWTAAAVLDGLEAAGQDQYGPGADAAIVVGLAGATLSAATGLTDWSDTHGKPQRVGAVHALLNVAAAALYGASYCARKLGNRELGRNLAFTGYGIVFAGAWLGGALAYRQRIGVDHSPDADNELPKDFVAVLNESELEEGKPTKATAEGTDIVLVKRGSEIFALADKCAHMGGPLSEGEVEGDTIRCPWHGSLFCLRDGSPLEGPTVHPQPKLWTEVRDGQVFVKRENPA